MPPTEPSATADWSRREPPPFRRVEVVRTEPLTPWLHRVTLGGPELAGFAHELPAASVRLLLPPRGGDLVVPTWQGNEFLLPDGSRPLIRTLTPLPVDGTPLRLDLAVVVHDGGPLSAWVLAAEPGDTVALSGPGRGFALPEGTPAVLLAGDETALPAIGQLVGSLPEEVAVDVLVEVAHPDARLDLPPHPRLSVTWLDLPAEAPPGDALVTAVAAATLAAGAHVWAAGEAAAVQRIRRHLFTERGWPRSQATVRGYWKQGRAGAGATE